MGQIWAKFMPYGHVTRAPSSGLLACGQNIWRSVTQKLLEILRENKRNSSYLTISKTREKIKENKRNEKMLISKINYRKVKNMQ